MYEGWHETWRGSAWPARCIPAYPPAPPADPEDADHHQGIASGDADVQIDVVPMNAGLA